ncbi:hypothetical protein L1987_20193 [Smallanthus sonchifolius]|uniref:Uncharacterized protein n=1 Tax=Smallanthus sonchifolius TaxID=185202 RepID=A0ACB9IST7_9ASTR|nr:hypothetical protein L1987_20193 [Smallanthus sonchifolius]
MSIRSSKGKKLEQLKIPLTNIQLATDDFSETYKIAYMDGFTLYRAELNHFDKENPSSVEGNNKGGHPKRHNTVLIKRYPDGHDGYGKKEYFTELETLTSVMHRNIVTLLGFCFEGSEMILVIENFSNGYLHEYLGNVDKMRVLTWEKRLKICIDVAQALNYLHYELEDQKIIINRDICMYNIGLDENLGAKIVHFWFSVFMPRNQEDEALYLMWIGRPFNIDPEYKMTRKLKRESDIYSFGVVLFEILCGRPSYDSIYLKESKEGLPLMARRNFCTRTLEDMIDPIIKEETGENTFLLNRGPNKDSLHTFIELAYQCIAETQDQRPTIKVVVKELEKALLFQKNNKDNPRISLEVINQATQNFHDDNCIGGGGFGRVFKGTFQDGDGFKTIVAKRLDKRLL